MNVLFFDSSFTLRSFSIRMESVWYVCICIVYEIIKSFERFLVSIRVQLSMTFTVGRITQLSLCIRMQKYVKCVNM